MVDERPDTGLPDLNFKVTGQKMLRALKSFDEEVKMMHERMDKVKPFREGELIIEAMGITRAECPFDVETWICNMGYWQIFQLDGHFSKIFLTHKQVYDVNRKPAFSWEEFNKMIASGVEVYNTHKVKGLNAKPYPFKRIAKKYKTEYFSNTIAYMLALAIDMGYKKISLYGCDMMTRSEYAWEKGGIEYWLGVAMGKGIEIYITDGSSLMKTITGKPYGVDYFRMKDIDPTGTLRRRVKAIAPKTNSSGFECENPVKPPDPVISPFVSVRAETFNTIGRSDNK